MKEMIVSFLTSSRIVVRRDVDLKELVLSFIFRFWAKNGPKRGFDRPSDLTFGKRYVFRIFCSHIKTIAIVETFVLKHGEILYSTYTAITSKVNLIGA